MTETPAPEALASALLAMGQAPTADETERLAAEIARHGSAERLALTLAHDEAGRLLALLNAWRAFQMEDAEPALRIARLRREADALDHRAAPAWIEAAEMHGKASARRLRGEPDLADSFHYRALAAEGFAIALEDEAFAKRLEAAHLEASARDAAAFVEVLAAVAA